MEISEGTYQEMYDRAIANGHSADVAKDWATKQVDYRDIPTLNLPTLAASPDVELPTKKADAALNLSSLESTPALEATDLNLGADTSVINQRDKILRYDSLPMQQARIQAREEGTPSGQIHSSQQEGAAMRALSSEATALGQVEAEIAQGEQTANWTNANELAKSNWEQTVAENASNWEKQVAQETSNWEREVANNQANWEQETAAAQANWSQDISDTQANWVQKTNEAISVYEKQYAERLTTLGISSEMSQLMATLNSGLSQSMLTSTTTLMNNTDIELDDGAINNLLEIVNSAQDNNNLTLDMGFTY